MFSVPYFDGEHYERWSLDMKEILKYMDLLDVVEKGIQQVPLGSSSATDLTFSIMWKQLMQWKDMQALSIIRTGLSNEIFPCVASATSSKEAWEILLVRSGGGPMFQARKLVDLKKKYKDMTMSDSETIQEFTGKLMELVFCMKSCGCEVEDKVVVKKILSSLPPKFDRVLVGVAETLSISALIDCLLVHEYNMRVPDQRSLKEPVVQSVNVEENSRKFFEIWYAIDWIAQNQLALMKRQDEVVSLVQQNQKMQTQMEKQMMVLMQKQDQILSQTSESCENEEEEWTEVINSLKKHNLKE